MGKTKRKFLIGTLTLLLAFTLCIGVFKPQEVQAATKETVSVSGTYDYSKAFSALSEVNKQRSKAGASSLTMDATLMEEAMSRAAELSVYYDANHIRPDGSSWSTHYSKLGGNSAENCAAGYKTASAAVTGWYNSSAHRKNMLNSKYKSTGIGCFTNNGITYWVQVFSDKSASSVNKSGTKNVTVKMSVSSSNLKNLKLVPNSSYIDYGGSTTVTAYLTNRGNSNYTSVINSSCLSWSSSSTSVATVSSGTVKGKGAGTAKITAKSSGGSVSVSTTIKVNAPKTSISKCTITLSGTSYAYNGKEQKPSVSVKYNGKNLTPGIDYTISYSNNVNVGTGKVTITGKGDYTGSITKTFTIKQASVSLSKCTVTIPATSYSYTGSAVKPAVTVKYGSTTLKEGTDYTVSYSNNVKIGTATVKVTGKGSYTGSVTKSFQICESKIVKGLSISGCTVTLSQTSYTYTGSAITPSVTVKFGSTTLKNGTDYTLSYSNNVNVGTGTVTITGKGQYYGTITKSFNITKSTTISISKCSFSLKSAGYNSDGTAKNPIITVTYGSSTLKEGTDYTLTYKNNNGTGTGVVTVTGKGNYSGSVNISYASAAKSNK